MSNYRMNWKYTSFTSLNCNKSNLFKNKQKNMINNFCFVFNTQDNNYFTGGIVINTEILITPSEEW